MEPRTTKPISIEEINKIEMRNDGKDAQRFNNLLRKVVSVPKDVIDKRIEQERDEKSARKTPKG